MDAYLSIVCDITAALVPRGLQACRGLMSCVTWEAMFQVGRLSLARWVSIRA
ncbi:hypothetical protein AIIMSPaA1_048 [Pseudomonas phage AIIMS-Pa-A1]|uniref:Uncharacterized protein n=1 Tax=Pseudomonas phage AIIMS-Pa-A1 TaxID=2794941 RepID=A0A7T1TW27_9CAUD|nr:hypothetical protein AIIMSPaA1_048 [Pseudomonas phage AIIMS-Pa-A1]